MKPDPLLYQRILKRMQERRIAAERAAERNPLDPPDPAAHDPPDSPDPADAADLAGSLETLAAAEEAELVQALSHIQTRLATLQTHLIEQVTTQVDALQAQIATLQAHLGLDDAPAPPDTPGSLSSAATTEPASATSTDTSTARSTPALPLLFVAPGAGDSPAPPLPDLLPNGINGATGQRLVQQIDPAAARQMATTQEDPPDMRSLHRAKQQQARLEHLGVVFGIDPDRLDQSRWALVVNSHDKSNLIQALLPLLEHRSQQQGITLPPLTFREGESCGTWFFRHIADPNVPWTERPPVLLYHPDESCQQWLHRHGVSHGPVDPRRGVPFYLLLVGHPGPVGDTGNPFIPFVFQYELDMFWGVGRLCFTSGDGQHMLRDYTRYAQQVVHCEQGRPAYGRHMAFFGTRHPGDTSTERSAQELIVPLSEGHGQVPGVAAQHTFRQQVLLEAEATRSNLEALFSGQAGQGRPALLFSATHGVGFPADDDRLLRHQGALLCQDWTGLGSIKREHWFAGEDFSDQTRIEGLIAVLFACYSNGCPQHDQYVFRVEQGSTQAHTSIRRISRPPIAPFPLIGQLPQQMLARGALAVLGHVDRAWSSSFGGAEVSGQTQAFEDVLNRLLAGKRMGFATDQFNVRQGALSAQLTNELENISFGKQVSDLELAGLWRARNDARNYALLGDPAVRLPVEQMGAE